MARPVGYDRSHVQPASRGDCLIGVGFSRTGGEITAFLVDLQYAPDPVGENYTQIARFDHNPGGESGHDIREEGLHLDVERKAGRKIRFWPSGRASVENLGIVIRACVGYLYANADFLVAVYEGLRTPDSVPPWTV